VIPSVKTGKAGEASFKKYYPRIWGNSEGPEHTIKKNDEFPYMAYRMENGG